MTEVEALMAINETLRNIGVVLGIGMALHIYISFLRCLRRQ